MTINENLRVFAGLPVVDYRPDAGLREAASNAWALRREWDDPPLVRTLDAFVADPRAPQVTAVVVGMFTDDYSHSSQAVIDHLTSHAARLPSLRALFLGDMTFEECEISWIVHGDVTQLLEGFPLLEELGVRGGGDVGVRPVEHARLRRLTFETGGMPEGVVRAVCASRLPALEHLELWLGTPDYGGDVSVADLAPILAGDLFPSLRHLGLRDAENADEVAAAVARSAVVSRLTSLDLSLGTLSDEGGRALLASPAVLGLRHLDLHHHYLSVPMMAELVSTGVDVDLGDPQPPEDENRYVAVSE